jgi:hypothetical protein
MDQKLWQRAKDIFHRALACAPEARQAFLDKACGGDTEVWRQIELTADVYAFYRVTIQRDLYRIPIP